MTRIFFTILLVGMILIAYGQPNFEARIAEIKQDILIITEQEKEALRIEVEIINEKLAKKEITASEAELQKKQSAENCAERIETRVEPLEREIRRLVRGTIEDAPPPPPSPDDMDIPAPPSPPEFEGAEPPSPPDAPESKDDESVTERIFRGDLKDFTDEWKPKSKKRKSENRTTSQFVFSFGLNNVISGSDLNSLENNGIKSSNSRFYEWGWTWKTRLFKESPLLQLKYGMSLVYNNLRPDDNKYFIKSGEQTILATHDYPLTDEPYFRRINLVVPVHLEFDFSKRRLYDDRVVVRSQKSFRVGIGGYAGVTTRTKQILEYKHDGLRTEEITKGDYNTRQFVYGVSGYIGYRDVSIYTKYDLNSLFVKNAVDQHNISLGIRFDFN